MSAHSKRSETQWPAGVLIVDLLARRTLSVDLSSMADAEDEDNQFTVADGVDDPIVSGIIGGQASGHVLGKYTLVLASS